MEMSLKTCFMNGITQHMGFGLVGQLLGMLNKFLYKNDIFRDI